jgi:hypothetical protein
MEGRIRLYMGCGVFASKCDGYELRESEKIILRHCSLTVEPSVFDSGTPSLWQWNLQKHRELVGFHFHCQNCQGIYVKMRKSNKYEEGC